MDRGRATQNVTTALHAGFPTEASLETESICQNIMADNTRLVVVTSPIHHEKLVSGLWNLFSAKHLLDFDLELRGQSVRVHQLIVEAFLSPDRIHRSNLCDHQYSARRTDTPAVTGEDETERKHPYFLQPLLEFLYKGTVSVPAYELKELLDAANELDFQILVDAIKVAAAEAIPDPPEEDEVSIAADEEELSDPAGLQEAEADVNDEDWEERPTKRRRTRWSRGTKKLSTVATSSSRPIGSMRPVRSSLRNKIAAAKKVEETEKLAENQFRIVLTSGPGDFEAISEPNSENHFDGEGADDSTAVSRVRKMPYARHKRSLAANKASKTPVDPNLIISCSHCDYKCRNQNRMQMHQATHDPSITILRCELCSRNFLSPEKLARHQSRHSTNKCPHCDFETPRPTAYYQHLYSRHKVNSGGQPLQQNCPACEFTCVLPSQLRRHWTRKHTSERPFRCDLCQYSSVTKEDVSKHVRRMHLGLKPFSCDICGQCSATRYHLNRHKITHTRSVVGAFGQPIVDPELEIKIYVCHICGHSCNRQDNLKTHLKTHEKKGT